MAELHPVLYGMVMSFINNLEKKANELGVYNGERKFRKESKEVSRMLQSFLSENTQIAETRKEGN
jgi:hypothetical protein